MNPTDDFIPETELGAIYDALEARGVNWACPECGGESQLGGKYAVARCWDGRGANPTERDRKVYAFALLICKACGYTRMFSQDQLLNRRPR